MKRLLSLLLLAVAGLNVAFAAVNINTASIDELDAVKGIGPGKAKAIVEYRTKNGLFKSVDDLKGVKGFGDKTLAKLKPELSVGDGVGAVAGKAPKK